MSIERKSHNLYVLCDATCNIQKVFLLFLLCCLIKLIKFRLFIKAKNLYRKALDKW